jgi:hypothetical protein
MLLNALEQLHGMKYDPLYCLSQNLLNIHFHITAWVTIFLFQRRISYIPEFHDMGVVTEMKHSLCLHTPAYSINILYTFSAETCRNLYNT